MELQEREEFKADLAGLLSSQGWRQVIQPGLVRRCTAIERRLARGKRLGIEELRELQAKHALLTELLEGPVEFFLADVEEL